MGPEAEKSRMAGDFILKKSKPETITVEQVKPKGTYSHTYIHTYIHQNEREEGLDLNELRCK